ncbi:MaoC/PaaZ C-terminal domain-containing protein [Aestuariimicrobium ganziense]|uniref:MaoC/PaaZ C-terminal domain-containing protein n=1 Tax=Aestuariimicrobium ganziense TaxID=2773677 RepID=UPI001945B34F|nr:MaoC/PaaZ C-terminal domain-containing protein [Aestuariimicrobium ganziense]
MSTLASVTVGDQLPTRSVHLTRADAVRYAGASGDFNPIHWSDRAAQALGLPGVLVHGMWTMGQAASAVTDWAGGAERVASVFVRFTKPVLIPDTDEGVLVEFTGAVTEVTDETVVVALEATCGDDKVIGAARAEVWRAEVRR